MKWYENASHSPPNSIIYLSIEGLPSELPKDASLMFENGLKDFIIPLL